MGLMSWLMRLIESTGVGLLFPSHTERAIMAQGFDKLNKKPHVKERVLSRWLLTYTLARNPKLILMRKQTKQNTKDAEFAFVWAVTNIS